MSSTGGQGIGSDIIGLFSFGLAKRQAEIANEESALNAKLTNNITGAQNAASAAQGSLAAYVQSVNNNRKLISMGNAESANTVNTLRNADDRLTNSVSMQIAGANQMGRMVATQAASGAAGSTVDSVNRSTDLISSITESAYQARTGKMVDDAALSAGAIAHNGIASMDSSVVIPQFNYNVVAPQHTNLPNGFTYKLSAVMNGISDFFSLKWGDTTKGDGNGYTGQDASLTTKAQNWWGGASHASTQSGFSGAPNGGGSYDPSFNNGDWKYNEDTGTWGYDVTSTSASSGNDSGNWFDF
jgi:hypothetical protein